MINIIFLLLSPLAFSNTPSKFKISCEVEMTNGSGTKTLKATSPLFEGKEIVSDSTAKLEFRPYTLISEIRTVSTKFAAMHPELSMEIFKGDPVRASIYRANLEGIDWKNFNYPLGIQGYQFNDFEHEKVKYSRLDYNCRITKN
jgi:hypothetical protein